MKNRRLDYELMRIIAIFLVVFNHTEERGYFLYQVSGGSAVNCGASLVLGVCCKAAVPLFLLVSGGLLLPRQEPVSVLLKKRVLRIFLALVLFSGLLYLAWVHWGYVEAPSAADFLRRLWGEGISIPYWYLYTYLGLLLLLPILRPAVRAIPDKGFVWLFALHLAANGILAPLGYFLEAPNTYFMVGILQLTQLSGTPRMAAQALFYFVMGYYLAERFPWSRVKGRQLAVLGVAAVCSVAVMAGLTWYDFSQNGQSTQDFQCSLLCIPVLFLYALCRQLVVWHPVRGWCARLIAAAGGCTFGAYLLEGILRKELMWIYDGLHGTIHVLPACLVWVAAVVVSGLAITGLLKKIPGLKKLL